MTTASLENCKRLFELSGWSDPTYTYQANGYTFLTYNKKQPEIPNEYPAYDLGYLLRKLPHQLNGVIFSLIHHDSGAWIARYVDTPHHYGQAPTPEDAVALLCIKLIEDGIL